VTHAKARDRRVIRNLIGRDHPEGDVFAAPPFDAARGTLTDGIGVDQQRNHHRRVMRRPTPPVLPI